MEHVVVGPVGEPQVTTHELDPVGQGVARLTVRGHLGDPQQARGRRGPHLEPVDLADQPVERVAERLDVQHGSGDLAEVDPTAGVAVGADEQSDHARRLEGEVQHQEEQVAQRHAVALGLRGDRDVVGSRDHPRRGEPERLDGPRSLDGLGQRGVDPRVGRTFVDVGLRRPAQIAAHRPRRGGEGRQRRQGEHDGVEQHRHDGEHHGEERDDRHRYAVLHRPTHRADVAGDPGDQVAGAGTLHTPQGEPQDRAHDVFAGAGQQVLAEQRRGALGREGEQRLRAHHADDQEGKRAQTLRCAAGGVDRAVDELAQEPWHHQGGRCREGVEHDQRREAAPPGEHELLEEGQHGLVAGDRPAAGRVAGLGVVLLRPLAAQVVPAPQGVVALTAGRPGRGTERGRHRGGILAALAPRLGRRGQQVGHRPASSTVGSSSARATRRR